MKLSLSLSLLILLSLFLQLATFASCCCYFYGFHAAAPTAEATGCNFLTFTIAGVIKVFVVASVVFVAFAVAAGLAKLSAR